MPISWKVGRARTGACRVTVGLLPTCGVIGYGTTPAEALHTAAGAAADLQGIMEEHPELALVLPPGTGLALKGISAASAALKAGHAPADVAKAVGPKTAAVAIKLLSLFA